ncbi:MAG: SDR family oxidoreductase [Planctomycetota bacterium]|nr:SDR family oxidoreductase [Planctomycetota bacterium]
MANLEGKIAWVTGSSRGIGRAIALRLARDGADIAIHGRSEGGASRAHAEEAAEAVRALGRRAICVSGDIARKDEVGAAVAAIEEGLGGLDLVVLNAARAPFKETPRLLERDLRMLVDTNLLGHVFCVQKALPLMEQRGGGSIVFISSLGSRYMNPQYPLGPMKAAMEAMVRQWAEELREKGVGANAICAGLVKTDSYKTLRRIWPELSGLPDEAFVTPEEVADVTAFLCGADAAAISGQTLIVDRGLSNRILRAPTTE